MLTCRKLATLLIIILFLIVPLMYVNPVTAQQEVNIFSDNFESYSLGSFPSAGGWEIVFNGRGDQYQAVSNAYSYSPTKSLQLWGQEGWSAVVQRRFSSTASSIGFEFAILIEARGSGGVDHPAFFNREEATWGAYYATVLFDHSDGKIKSEDGTVLGSWSAGRWYRIKVILNRQTNTYNIWIDGQLVGQNLRTSRANTDKINAIALTSAWPGQKVYYDDVRVFAVQEQSYLRVYFREAEVNGLRLDPNNPEITVSPGQRVAGYLRVIVDNNRGGSWITPVIGTASFTRGQSQCIDGDAPSGQSIQTYSFDLTAPSRPGTYYIGVFTGWMYTCDEVASNDHPPNYGDGDDVWDMPSQGWEEVIANGQASTGPYRMPGRAIRIVVQQEQAFNVRIVSYNAPSTATVAEYVSIFITVEYSLPQRAHVGLSVSVQNPDGSWNGIWYNPDYGTPRTGSGRLSYTASFNVPSQPGTYNYGIVASYWYQGLSDWVISDERTFQIVVQQPQPTGDAYEPDNTMAQAKEIKDGERQQRSIDPVGDVDWAMFTLSQRSKIILKTYGLGTHNYDTVIELYDSQGRQIAFNDDYEETFWSHIEKELDTGTYYVKVYEYGNNNRIPEYFLSLDISAELLRIYWSKIYHEVKKDRNLVIWLSGPDKINIGERSRFFLGVAVTYPDGRIVGLNENDIPGPVYLKDISTFIGLDRRIGANYFAPSDMAVPIILFAKRLGPLGEPPAWYDYDYEKITYMGRLKDLFNLGFITGLTVSFGQVFQHLMNALQGLQNWLTFLASLVGLTIVPPTPPQQILDVNKYTLLFGNWPLPPRLIFSIAGYKVTAFTQALDLEFIQSGRNEIAVWISVHLDIEGEADRYYVSDEDVIIIPIEVRGS